MAEVVAADAGVCEINTSLTSEAGTFGTACALYISRFIGVSRQRPLSSGTCGAPPSPWTGLGRWTDREELAREGAGRHAHSHDRHGAESPRRQWGAGREGQGWTRPGRLLEEDGLERCGGKAVFLGHTLCPQRDQLGKRRGAEVCLSLVLRGHSCSESSQKVIAALRIS